MQRETAQLSVCYLEWRVAEVGWRFCLAACGDLMPVRCVLFIVQVFAPLYQIVYLVVKLFVLEVLKVLIVKWVVVKFFQLFGHLVVYLYWSVISVLLLNHFCILGVSVELAKPPDFPKTFLSFRQSFSLFWIKMEWFRLISGFNLNLIVRCQYFVIDRSPPIIFNSFVPALMFITRVFIKRDINRRFLFIFLHLVIIARSE